MTSVSTSNRESSLCSLKFLGVLISENLGFFFLFFLLVFGYFLQSHSEAQAGLQLLAILPPQPGCMNYLPCSVDSLGYHT